MLDRRLIRRSRADVIWGLALFVASQLALAVAIEYRLPALRDPRYACRATKLFPRTVGIEPKPLTVVMLGSSRVQDGFNPSQLEARLGPQLDRPLVLYNFGLPGAGPVANLIYFERLRSAGVRPDLLLVEVTPVMFAGRDDVPSEAKFFTADRLWRHELEVVERFGIPAEDLRRDWWQDWPVPCHGHRFAMVSWVMPQLLPYSMRLVGDRRVDASGWSARNMAPLTAEQRRIGTDYTRQHYGATLAAFRLSQAACRVQRNLLRRCREEGIPTALIWMPEGKLFRSWYPPEVEAQIRRFLEELMDEFDMPLVDTRGWVEDDGFIDNNHLHASGAAVFTERFGREVLEPILALPRQEWGGYLASKVHLGEPGDESSVARRDGTKGDARAAR